MQQISPSRPARQNLGSPHAAGPMTPPQRIDELRSHSDGRLLLFTKGQGRITIAGLTHGFGPYNLIYLPAQTLYSLDLGPNIFVQVLTLPPQPTHWPNAPLHLRLRDGTAQKEALHLFEQIEKERAPQGDPRAHACWLGLLQVFVERQASATASTDSDPRRKSGAAKLVARYTHLVARDLRVDRSVADYAAELGVTPTHLARCCAQIAGRAAISLRNDRVNTEARQLLRSTGLPVGQIAQMLGFQSPAYFTRSFHDRMGLTPSAYRSKHAPAGAAAAGGRNLP